MGGRRSNGNNSGGGPTADDPCSNCSPTCGGQGILVTTTIFSGPGRYCGRWLLIKNQQPAGTVWGGGGRKSIRQLRTCVWRKNQPRQRQRPKETGRSLPTDDDEAGARTILFGRRDMPRPVLSTLLLTTTSIQEVHGRQ